MAIPISKFNEIITEADEVVDFNGIVAVHSNSSNGQKLSLKTVEIELTSLSGATATATDLIPAGAVVIGVTTRVTTTITGATGYDVGDSDQDRWGTNIDISLDTTSDNTDWTDGSLLCYPNTTSVVLTALGSSFTGGSVRISVHYIEITAPTT